MKKENLGSCGICGVFGKLTFEHVPPKSALNNKPVSIQGFQHLFPGDKYLFGKNSKSYKGFGGETLCGNCNNLTGAWYGDDFSKFVHQGLDVVHQVKEPTRIITGQFKIKPLSVLKQIVSMFFSADHKLGHLRSDKKLVEFVLEKEKLSLPENFKIYLYFSMSKVRRKIGVCEVSSIGTKSQTWSEINFPPFGYFLTEKSNPPSSLMCDISGFGEFAYGVEKYLTLRSGYLNIRNPIIGTYS